MNRLWCLGISATLTLVPGCRSVPPENTAPSAPSFWKSRLDDVEAAVGHVTKGTVSVLARTPGKRKVYLAAYGAPQDRHGSANYNSACGGADPASYVRKDGPQNHETHHPNYR